MYEYYLENKSDYSVTKDSPNYEAERNRIKKEINTFINAFSEEHKSSKPKLYNNAVKGLKNFYRVFDYDETMFDKIMKKNTYTDYMLNVLSRKESSLAGKLMTKMKSIIENKGPEHRKTFECTDNGVAFPIRLHDGAMIVGSYDPDIFKNFTNIEGYKIKMVHHDEFVDDEIKKTLNDELIHQKSIRWGGTGKGMRNQHRMNKHKQNLLDVLQFGYTGKGYKSNWYKKIESSINALKDSEPALTFLCSVKLYEMKDNKNNRYKNINKHYLKDED
jgi:hypothetical protein